MHRPVHPSSTRLFGPTTPPFPEPQPRMPSSLLALAAAASLAFGHTPPSPAATPVSLSAAAITEKPAPSAARVEAALDALAAHVTKQSHPDALRLAVRAFYRFRAAHPEQVRKPYLYFVDYGLPSRTPRGYLFDMDALTVVDGPFTVAHGRGSSGGGDGVPLRFMNKKDSAASSLGLYLAQETYAFRGKTGGRRYRSLGLRLRGVSGRFNSAARDRGVVVHGAPYVTADRAGRSEGCPAMQPSRAERLIPRIANGGLVFLFSPVDAGWMHEDPWAGAS